MIGCPPSQRWTLTGLFLCRKREMLLTKQNYPRFTKEQEARLAKKMNEGKDARHQLILSCIPFAIRIATKRVRNHGMRDDIYSAAMLGLIRAVDSFDPSRGRLTTVVARVIQNGIYRDAGRHTGTVSLPSSISKSMTPETQKQFAMASIGATSIQDIPTNHRGLLTPEHPADDIDDDEKEAMHQWIETCLSEREREVIQARLDGKKLREVGESLGVSRERVRQIEETAIAKLKQKAQEMPRSD